MPRHLLRHYFLAAYLAPGDDPCWRGKASSVPDTTMGTDRMLRDLQNKERKANGDDLGI